MITQSSIMPAHSGQTLPEFLTVAEVASHLRVSTDTVIRKFEKVSGVLDLGSEETRSKRRHRVLRIPRSVLNKFIIANGIQ